MYLIQLSLKSIRRNSNTYVVFCILLVILITVTFVILSLSIQTENRMDAVLREYGNAYKLQENFGNLPPKKLYDNLLDLSYVNDIEYKKYTHIILKDNLTLRINDNLDVQSSMFMISGFPDYSEWPLLDDGRYPEINNECTVMMNFYPQCHLGDILYINDTFSGIQKEVEIVGIIDGQVLYQELDILNYTGDVILTTLDCAYEFYSPIQKNNVFINGVIQGFDATIYLTDYIYGEEFRDYISSKDFESGNYSAIHQRPGFEAATRGLNNTLDLCSLLHNIVVSISYFVLLFFIALKTYLKIYDISILRSMGLKKKQLLLMTFFEYGCILCFSIFISIVLSGTIIFFFVNEQTLGETLLLFFKNIPLVASYLIIMFIATAFSVAIVDKLSITKILRSSNNI